jgi:hypothetical protein
MEAMSGPLETRQAIFRIRWLQGSRLSQTGGPGCRSRKKPLKETRHRPISLLVNDNFSGIESGSGARSVRRTAGGEPIPVKRTLWPILLLAGLFLQPLSLRPFAAAGDAPPLQGLPFPAGNGRTGRADRPLNTGSGPAGITKALQLKLEDGVDGEDIFLRAVYTPKSRTDTHASPWSVYSSVNGTRKPFEGSPLIDRIRVGGHKRLSTLLVLNGETSIGESGLNSIAGGSYRLNDRISLYGNYRLHAERTGGGYGNPDEALSPGVRVRLSPQVGLFGEERMQSADGATALTHVFGVDLTAGTHWTLGATLTFGDRIEPEAGATERRAGRFSIAYLRRRLRYSGQFELTAQNGEAAPSAGFNTRHSLDYHLGAGWRCLAGLNASYASVSGATAFNGARAEWEAGLARGPIDEPGFKLSAKYTLEPEVSEGTTADLQAGFYCPISEATRLGVGYNLSDFSSDGTAHGADSRGWFLEISVKL